MGLFSKEPAEKKAYDKALIAMLSKPNAKTMAAMEDASAKWPGGWQGYLFIGLCYDLASCKMPFDPGRADLYHQKAKEAGRKAGCGWIESFYATFEESAGNFRTEEDYFPRVEYIRKTGAAMLQWHEVGKNNILPEKSSKDDVDFWYPLFMGIDTGSSGLFKKPTEEQSDCMIQESCFSDYATACLCYRSAMQNDLIKRGDSIIEDAKKLASEKTDMYYMSTKDTSAFVLGYVNLIGGGPFVDVLPDSSRRTGWKWIWLSAHSGCMSALHFLADLFNSDMGKEIRAAGADFYSMDEEKVLPQLLQLLELSYGRNDAGAMRRIQELKP